MRAGTLETGVVPQKAAAPIAVGGLRIIALGLLSISIFGNYVTFNGGWARWSTFDDQASMALLGALIWQGVFTPLQFAFLRTKFYPGYLFALAASAIPSMMAYYEPVYPWLQAINARLLPGNFPALLRSVLASVGAWIFLAMGVIGSDWLPERILIK